jgi:hypothetical protein
MDGVISFPIAIVSYIFLPDSPETCRGFLFTKEVRHLIGNSLSQS